MHALIEHAWPERRRRRICTRQIADRQSLLATGPRWLDEHTRGPLMLGWSSGQ